LKADTQYLLNIYVRDTVAVLARCWQNLKQNQPEWKVN